MEAGKRMKESPGERGTALVVALLALALMMTLVMGMSLTAISEMGVTNTYANQTQAFAAAEAGLYHTVNLIRNYTNAGGDPNFTNLLAERGTVSNILLQGNNPFTDSAKFASGCEMITDALGSDGQPITNSSGVPVGHQFRDASGNVVPGAYYSVHMIDDERSSSAAAVKVPNFNPPATPTWENGDATTDNNGRVVVYSTGTYGSASVTLEGWIGFMPYPALVAQYDINISGNSEIQGAYGGVHSNHNLIVGNGGGNSWHVEQTATASGVISPSVAAADPHVDGFAGQGQAQLYLPKFVTTEPLTSGGPATSPRIVDYITRKADRLLIDPAYASTNRTGETAQQRVNKLEARLNLTANSLWTAMTTGGANPAQEQAISITRDASTGVGTPSLISNVSDTGWRYNNGNGGYWDVQSSTIDGHSYYVIGLDNYNLTTPADSTANGGNVKLSSNAGTDNIPIHISILTTGSIELSGNPNFIAQMTSVQTTPTELPPFVRPSFLMVATEDIKIRGDASVPRFSGVIFAGEQFDLSGNGAIDGQVLGLSNPDVSGSPVSENSISGSFELTFNGGQSVGRIMLMSWRQIKQ
jgi:Tfp pilus assembly protein PilX